MYIGYYFLKVYRRGGGAVMILSAEKLTPQSFHPATLLFQRYCIYVSLVTLNSKKKDLLTTKCNLILYLELFVLLILHNVISKKSINA